MDYGLGLIAQGFNKGMERRSQEKAERERLERERAMEEQRLQRENEKFAMDMKLANQRYGLRQEDAQRQSAMDGLELEAMRTEREQSQQQMQAQDQQRQSINQLRNAQMAARAGDLGPMSELVGQSLQMPVRLRGVQNGRYAFETDSGGFEMSEQDINEFIGMSPEEWLESTTEVQTQKLTSMETNPERFVPSTVEVAMAFGRPELAVPRETGSQILERRAKLIENMMRENLGQDDEMAGVTDTMSAAQRERALFNHYLDFANQQVAQEWAGYVPQEAMDLLLRPAPNQQQPSPNVGVPQQQPPQRQGILDRLMGRDEPTQPANPGGAVGLQQQPRPGSMSNPVPITNISRDQLVEGMHYMTPEGVRVWNGQNLVRL